ncbi:MAG: RnfABCDGE type electron transport complex subunit G [Candidatus Omnitrophota bacterium]
MAKKESTFINMVATLFFVTLFSSAALGYVYELTKGPKAATDLAKKLNAIKEVVPEFTNNPDEEKFTVNADGQPLIFYPAKKDGQLVATAIETYSNQGFSGQIKLMVGLLPDGTIYKVKVIEHKETPGLGDKIEKKKSNFSQQFNEKDPSVFRLEVKKDGGDVDAITAATFSSRAFCDAVQRAYKAYENKERL